MRNFGYALLIGCIFIFTGCYYDIQEEIHPNSMANCDTANTTYTTKVAPILQSNCNGCHDGSQPSGGIRLDTYQGVQTMAANGKLLGSIEQKTGYRPMPPSGKLSDCDINTVRAWINTGSPNN